jgi:molybdate transport system substrate-binding protein
MSPVRRLPALPALLVLALLAVAGCGGSSSGSSGSGSGGSGGGNGQQTLHVLAASSLTEAFDRLAKDFESTHPGVTVTPVYDSSATLATQVHEGAPADVLATADLDTMQTVVDSHDVGTPHVFASNVLVMVTPEDDPAHVASFADLSRPDVTWVACVDTAPCGRLASTLAKRDHVRTHPKSLEVDVKSVLAKVTTGEADAGLVYATDAVAAGDQVRALPIPGSQGARTEYPIAVTRDSEAPGLAQDWVDLVRSAHGRQVLRAAGFGPGQ